MASAGSRSSGAARARARMNFSCSRPRSGGSSATSPRISKRPRPESSWSNQPELAAALRGSGRAERRGGKLLSDSRPGDSDRLHAVRLLRQVEPVGVHYLGPGADEVADELLLIAFLGIDFRGGAKLAIRTEDQVRPGRAPFLLLATAVVADELLVAALVDDL